MIHHTIFRVDVTRIDLPTIHGLEVWTDYFTGPGLCEWVSKRHGPRCHEVWAVQEEIESRHDNIKLTPIVLNMRSDQEITNDD